MDINERTSNRYEISQLLKGILRKLKELENKSGGQVTPPPITPTETSLWKREVFSFGNIDIKKLHVEPGIEYVLKDPLKTLKVVEVIFRDKPDLNSKMLEYRLVVTTDTTVGSVLFRPHTSANIVWKGGNPPELDNNTIYRFRIVQYPTHIFIELE
mgnify:CR=1 FL=1